MAETKNPPARITGIEKSAIASAEPVAPVWLLTYDFHGRSFQVVINGYTGAIAGLYPKSWIKVTLVVVAVLILLLVLIVANNR